MVDTEFNWEGWLEDATLFSPLPRPSNEPNFSNDLLRPSGKTGGDVGGLGTSLSDLDWLDEKVDLSIFDDPSSFTVAPQDAWLLEDAANLLLDFVGSSNLDVTGLPSANYEQGSFDLQGQSIGSPGAKPVQSKISDGAARKMRFDLEDLTAKQDLNRVEVMSPASSLYGSTGCPSPGVELNITDGMQLDLEHLAADQDLNRVEVMSPASSLYGSTGCLSPGAQSVQLIIPDGMRFFIGDIDHSQEIEIMSPASSVYDCLSPGGQSYSSGIDVVSPMVQPEEEDGLSSYGEDNKTILAKFLKKEDLSPKSIDLSDDQASECSTSDLPKVSVSVCEDDDPDYKPDGEFLTFDDLAKSVKKRKFAASASGKIPKVTLKNVFHPYARSAPPSRKSNSDKKKVQNKEAAARYRIKKRVEEKELSGEVAAMEAEQQKLQEKHDDLLSEIKYLKKLMREMLEKKGIIKN